MLIILFCHLHNSKVLIINANVILHSSIILLSTSLFHLMRAMKMFVLFFFSGLAYWNTPCDRKMGVSVNDASGLTAAYTVAHEMGHK